MWAGQRPALLHAAWAQPAILPVHPTVGARLPARRLPACLAERRACAAPLSQAHREGRLLEMFGSGTACVVQPVGSLVRATGEVFSTAAPFDAQRSLAGRLQRALLDIQYGRVEHPWSVVVE